MKDSCPSLRWGVYFLLVAFPLTSECRGQDYIRIESEAEAAVRQRMEKALSGLASIDCLDKPLSELADELAERMGVPIVLAKSALADAAITLDTPVTARMSGVSYRSLLRLVLKELDLTWTFRDEVILITTPEDAESMLETRLYPVLDLVIPAGSTPGMARREAHDYDTLIDTITTTVEPDSWDEVGGPGTIAEYPSSAALVISQTTEIHEQVEKVLAALRRVKQIQGIPATSLAGVPSKRLRSPDRAVHQPRSYSSSAAQAWQLPRVHVGE